MEHQLRRAPTKKARKPREKLPLSNQTEDRESLSTDIRSVRLQLKETQLVFARRLGVSRGRLAAWEAGAKPPVQKIIQLARIAPPEAKNRLWEHAGLDMKQIDAELRTQFLSKREGAGDVGAVQISLAECEAEMNAPARRGGRRVRFPLPDTRIPFPNRTVCLELPEGFPGVAWRGGDLLVVDTSRTDPQHLIGHLVAAYFTGTALNFPQPASRAPFEELRAISQEEEEFIAEWGPRSGVRLGWLRIEYPRGYCASGDPWRLALEPPVIAGLSRSWEDRLELDVSRWSLEEFPAGESLLRFVRKGVHIVGTVIGWLSGHQSPRAKPADHQEPK